MDTQINFDQILMQSIPTNMEFWLNSRDDDLTSPKLRIRLNYQQDEVFKLQNEIAMWENELRQDTSVIKQVREFI